jgi:hypothetical protein
MIELKYKNPLSISILDGSTKKLKERVDIENSISNDFLVGFGNMYQKYCNFANYMHLALLPDGPLWSSWTWDPTDPYVPYPFSVGTQTDNVANPYYAAASQVLWDGTNNRWELFYQWNALPQNFSLRAMGLLAIDWNGNSNNWGNVNGLTTFPVGTIAVLPTALSVLGRLGGTQVPDILQISYYFSVIGV